MLRTCARKLATAAGASAAHTKFTVLPNGLTVATEKIPHSRTATVGVWIDAGSRADVSDSTAGTAHFLEHLAFKGTQQRSQTDLELEVENSGGHLNAYTSRENTVYYAKATEDNIGRMVGILSDILTKSKLAKTAIEAERSVIIRESEEVDRMYDEVVFDRLHEVVYKDQPLGRTILGPLECIRSIQQQDLKRYIETNYRGDRMVLVGAGCVDHDEMVRLALEKFGHVPLSDSPKPLGTPRTSLPVFTEGEVRCHDPSLPNTYLAVTLEGCSWSDKDYLSALVAQAIVGQWDRGTNVISCPLAQAVSNNDNYLCNSFMSFSTSYADTGLWGVYLVVDAKSSVAPAVDAVVGEWLRLKNGQFSDEEVETAKAQLKGSLIMGLDGTTALAEDIGRQVVTTGKRVPPDEVVALVDAISKQDVLKWCQKRFADGIKVGVASVGPKTDSVPSFHDIANKLQN